jgi:hypothetical protein
LDSCSTRFACVLWMACICFIPCLSSWCLWTNIIMELMLIWVVGICDMVWWYDLLSKCLSAWEFYYENWKPFAKLLFHMPKSYQIHMMSYLENLILMCCLSLHWALSNCCDPCENSFHAFILIKIHVHPISPCYASTLEVSIVPSIYFTK